MDRRNFLGATLGTVAGVGQAQAAPYVNFDNMTTQQHNFYREKISDLQWRASRILGNLKETLASKNAAAYKKIENKKVTVFYYKWLAGVTEKGLELDVTVFWDLPDDSIACTLGHELAHIVLGHNSNVNNKQEEHAADLWGAKLAQQAGYSVEEALRGVYEAGGQYGKGSASHPSYTERVLHLRKNGYPLKINGTFHPETIKK